MFGTSMDATEVEYPVNRWRRRILIGIRRSRHVVLKSDSDMVWDVYIHFLRSIQVLYISLPISICLYSNLNWYGCKII